MRRAIILACAGFAALAASVATASAPSDAPGCRILPASNPWNQPLSGVPAAKNSKAIIKSIGKNDHIHADFGSGEYAGGPIGIPYTTVGASQPRVPVSFDYADESDPGPYPIPPGAPIEGGAGADGDRHVLVIDRADCVLYELYDAHPVGGGASWTAGSGAIFDLNSNAVRPNGWTSADAAGLPILPGLARFDEVQSGVIDHALRFTVSRSRNSHIYPARHDAGSSGKNLPPMGLRLKLKPGFNTSSLPPQARVIADALKRYGMIVADNGSDLFISGTPDPGWDNDQLHALDRIRGSDFKVVDSKKIPRPR
ncbi:MAG: hypothetical protein QOG62_459 [Thermoleophilaceae bacterium]|nr:hypothetical protein [Thermoleophilaceae bacterium]